MSDVASAMYDFWLHDFCDVYLEHVGFLADTTFAVCSLCYSVDFTPVNQ